MGVNGKAKGNRFELKTANQFTEVFQDKFKRVPSSGALVGGKNRFSNMDLRADAQEILAGDLIVPEWFPYTVECKNYADEPKFHQILEGESKKLDEWLSQASGDAEFAKKQFMLIFSITRKGTFVAFDNLLFQKDFGIPPCPYLMYRGAIIFSLDKFISIYAQEIVTDHKKANVQ